MVSPGRVNSSGTATSRNGSASNARPSTSRSGSREAITTATTGSASSTRAVQSPSRVNVIAKM